MQALQARPCTPDILRLWGLPLDGHELYRLNLHDLELAAWRGWRRRFFVSRYQASRWLESATCIFVDQWNKRINKACFSGFKPLGFQQKEQQGMELCPLQDPKTCPKDLTEGSKHALHCGTERPRFSTGYRSRAVP